jgi:hypothetical protein
MALYKRDNDATSYAHRVPATGRRSTLPKRVMNQAKTPTAFTAHFQKKTGTLPVCITH